MNTRIRTNIFAFACALVALAAGAVVADAASTNKAAVKGAVKYMGNAGLSQWPGTGFKADAVSALASAKKSHYSVPSKTRERFIDAVEKDANDYLGSAGPNTAAQAGRAGKLILAATAAGKNPRCFGPPSAANKDRLDLVRAATDNYNSGKGQYGKTAFDHALAMLALKAAHEKIPSKAVKFARERRGKFGWNYALAKNSGDDIESTSLMIQALRAAGVSRKDGGLKSAYKWITYQRNTFGGYDPDVPAGPTQADATAYAIMAADSLGLGSAKAENALRKLQKGTGPFRTTEAADGTAGFGIATNNAVLALSGGHYPVTVRSKKGVPCG